jgi:hypothetical protein
VRIVVATIAAWAAVSISLVPLTASAHPLVDEGRRLYENGELLPALEVFGRAQAGDDLTLADLTEVFELRALVYRILGDEGAVEAELRRLAAIAPDHQFSQEVPPEVRETFVRMRARNRGRIEIRVEVDASGGSVALSARAHNDVAGLVDRIEIAGRTASQWAVDRAGTLSLEASPGERIEFYARAIGPGGVVLATLGDEDDPESRVIEDTSGGGLSGWVWLGIIGGSALVVAGVVVAVLLATAPGDQWQVLPPMEMP